MAENKFLNAIDIKDLARKLYSKRKLFLFKVWPITFALASFIIVCIPRYYTSESCLAPEIGGSMGGGGMLGSLASSFGFDLGRMETSDAINPMLYPDLMEDNGFVAGLFDIRVRTADGEIDTDYYTYLREYQKLPWWGYVTKWVGKMFKSLLPKKDTPTPTGEGGKRSPYWMTIDEDLVAFAIRGNIMVNMNEKTGVINILTKAQDPLVAKILADSVQAHLQQCITDYRTNKARIDVEHYERLTENALQEYLQACDEYSLYSDANNSVVMTSYKTKVENMEKEMQMKYTTYTSMTAQLESAKAKLQERTPAFTQLKGAAVPLVPAGPKRVSFVIMMLVLSTVVTIAVILRKDLTKIITVAGN